MNFFRFVSNLRIFFLIFEKTIKSQKTPKKFLDNRLKQFANITHTFFDERGFQRIEKNLKQFICIRTN